MRNFFVFVMVFTAVGVSAVFFYSHKKTIELTPNTEVVDVAKEDEEEEECHNRERRPIAVMIAEDAEARPLFGIGLADIVIEMPVVTGSITRMMAIFVCEDPVEVGSVRSARHDFIPLALGYDAILAHWGGSHLALDEINKGVIDNLDAMPNYFETFYRKRGISAPHDGFTSMERMLNAAEKLGYRLTSEFEGYKFLANQNFRPEGTRLAPTQVGAAKFAPSSDGASGRMTRSLEVGYKYPYNVRYEYDPTTNAYVRWRGGFRELDALNGEQVETKNVVVMRAVSRQIGGGYNDVDILGEGKAVVYRNGEALSGVWKKKSAKGMLRFYDENGEEISFVSGKIWIEVVEPSTVVVYK